MYMIFFNWGIIIARNYCCTENIVKIVKMGKHFLNQKYYYEIEGVW
jgi:hypothetical protein